jgi:hypothetical protein
MICVQVCSCDYDVYQISGATNWQLKLIFARIPLHYVTLWKLHYPEIHIFPSFITIGLVHHLRKIKEIALVSLYTQCLEDRLTGIKTVMGDTRTHAHTQCDLRSRNVSLVSIFPTAECPCLQESSLHLGTYNYLIQLCWWINFILIRLDGFVLKWYMTSPYIFTKHA